MEAFIKLIIVGLTASLVLGLFAFLSGTALWLIWPAAVNAFPALVDHNILAEHLSWWQSVALIWVFALLFKSTINYRK